MKTVIALILLVMTGAGVKAQSRLELDARIESVTVYPRGAEVEEIAGKTLTTGRHTLVFSGLSAEIDPQSVSVAASKGVNVLSVTTQNNYLRKPKLPQPVQKLRDSLEAYTFDHKFNENMLGVYAQERAMILANQKVGWEKTQFVIEDLEDLSDFYRDRLADIMLKAMELEEKQKKLQAHIDRLKRQLQEMDGRTNRATGEVLVEVQATGNVNASIHLKYMVKNAGWSPAYKIMVADVEQPLHVAYNAKVFQNTGVDWEGVTLTLTNANPNRSGQKPDLVPWRLDFYEAVPLRSVVSNKALEVQAASMERDDSGDMFVDGNTVDHAVNRAITRFEIKTRHTIPASGKPQVIGIDAFTIPARYEYFASPKLDPAAFLVAKVAGFEKYDLLPGQANLFLDNTFVGEAYLDPNVVSDTLELSLGRDQSIVVKREKVKDFEAARKIGNAVKETIAIQVSVRNNKSGKIQLTIEDQIPVSGNKEIVVGLEEAGGARLDEPTGKLTWKRSIPGNSREELTFRYSVKHPSDRKINF